MIVRQPGDSGARESRIATFQVCRFLRGCISDFVFELSTCSWNCKPQHSAKTYSDNHCRDQKPKKVGTLQFERVESALTTWENRCSNQYYCPDLNNSFDRL